MNKDYNILKKYYGEKFAKLCRELFPTLLEKEGVLSNIIISKFSTNHFLYDDIIKKMDPETFKNYIYSFVDVEKKEIEINKTVKELLNEAGYNFYECKTENDIQSFKRYYEKGEELCTFNGGRLNRCHVFWAVKKNVDNIKREDFKKPTREDEYGTSVISIQFTKSGNTLSIKNRYNHRVNNPDATFSNNLDNIIPGLTSAFEREYGFKINQNGNNDFYLSDYVIADDGKWYKYNYEINNIYYCPNNIIIDNGEIKKYDSSRYIIMDYYIIDMKEKTVKLYDNYIPDSFSKIFNNTERIEIEKNNSNKRIIIKSAYQEESIIEINEHNRIVKFNNQKLTKLDNYFLYYNTSLEEIIIPNIKEIKSHVLHCNREITEIDLPRVKEIGEWFLINNVDLKRINIPIIKEIGDGFLRYGVNLREINMPQLKKAGNDFLQSNLELEKVSFPNLQEVGINFLERNQKINDINMPKLEKAGNNFLKCNKGLIQINIPKLKESGDGFLKNNNKLSKLSRLKLKLKEISNNLSKENKDEEINNYKKR